MAVLESLLPLLAPKPAATPTTSLAQIADYGATTPPVSDPNQGDPTVAYGAVQYGDMTPNELNRAAENHAKFGDVMGSKNPFTAPSIGAGVMRGALTGARGVIGGPFSAGFSKAAEIAHGLNDDALREGISPYGGAYGPQIASPTLGALETYAFHNDLPSYGYLNPYDSIGLAQFAAPAAAPEPVNGLDYFSNPGVFSQFGRDYYAANPDRARDANWDLRGESGPSGSPYGGGVQTDFGGPNDPTYA